MGCLACPLNSFMQKKKNPDRRDHPHPHTHTSEGMKPGDGESNLGLHPVNKLFNAHLYTEQGWCNFFANFLPKCKNTDGFAKDKHGEAHRA